MTVDVKKEDLKGSTDLRGFEEEIMSQEGREREQWLKREVRVFWREYDVKKESNYCLKKIADVRDRK